MNQQELAKVKESVDIRLGRIPDPQEVEETRRAEEKLRAKESAEAANASEEVEEVPVDEAAEERRQRLITRADDDTPFGRRVRLKARAAGLDWTNPVEVEMAARLVEAEDDERNLTNEAAREINRGGKGNEAHLIALIKDRKPAAKPLDAMLRESFDRTSGPGMNNRNMPNPLRNEDAIEKDLSSRFFPKVAAAKKMSALKARG